ncbi:MAG: MBL fold metallo-hydrolase [Caldilinea sp.]|nr:MBL fold metallo-hydrolase [Caldilinea sp.]
MSASIHRFSVGKFTCTIVPDGTFAYEHPAAVFFANAPADAVDGALRAHAIDPAAWHHYVSPYPSLVVDTGTARVLVDTGAGNLAPTTGQLLPNLRAAGIEPESIDIVVITHGHADHNGGNVTADGKLAFPRASFVMWRAEWEFWTEEPDLSSLPVPDFIRQALLASAAHNLPPLAGRVELLVEECEIVPGIHAIAAPGHTPGHMALSISSAGEQLLHLVDTVLHPLHMEHPEWVSAVDLLPEQTVAARHKLLARAAEEQALVMVYHFPAPGLGTVRAVNDGWTWNALKEGEHGR